MANNKTALQRAREWTGLNLRQVAKLSGIDVAGLGRMETGENLPKRETASKLFKLYGGHVPLGVIYDPTHRESLRWARETKLARLPLKELGDHLRAKHKLNGA